MAMCATVTKRGRTTISRSASAAPTASIAGTRSANVRSGLLDGAPGWLATALDIDDIITARIALERTGDLLRLAQDAAEAGVWEWDLLTGRVWQSQESARMQGLPLDEADPAAGLSMTMEEWERNVPDEDVIRVRNEARRAIATLTNHRV